MRLKNKINPEFDYLFSFSSEKEEIEHEAKMLMFQFLDKIQIEAEAKKINRKTLAKKIGTSASYITQLFRGDKLINLTTLAKFQKELDLQFKISVNQEDQEITLTQKDIFQFLNQAVKNSEGSLLLLYRNSPKNKEIDYTEINSPEEKMLG